MSILVEIAGKADVSVEGVVRVLTREPVSSAVKERVLAVLDQLDAEQTRVLERFALAAVHDVVPLDPDAEVTEGTDAPPDVHEGQLALGESPASGDPTFDSAANGRSSEVELPPGLGTLLEELVGAVWEIRHESRSNRQERLDDLAVLVDLMTTSWQGVDRRLARLEQLLARREALWQTSVPFPAHFERAVPQPLLDVPPPAIPPDDADDGPSWWKRSWPPFAGTLLLLLCLVGIMFAFDLLPSRAEGPTLLPARENGSGTTGAGTQTTETGSSSTVAPSARSSTPARTTSPTTTSSAPLQAPVQPRGTTTGTARQAPPPASTTPTTPTTATTPTTTGGAAIQPARVFVWPPVEGASAYSVRFFREGEPFYTARVPGARLAIPKRIVFTPGAYRWVVRPQTANGLGSPIIESTFSVARP
ncbi:MAG TPA: hypothetical protein VNP93_09150 [Gaiellaceae bacterium]|nr:hypothetical protein [Gaiellaceae bacterium]